MLAKSDKTVFLIGVFRSGTSLLCSLLNQNPEVALMYECDIWNFPRPLLKSRFQHDWPRRLEFYNQVLSRHGLVVDEDYSTLKDIRSPADLYRVYGSAKGAKVGGEKSPFYCCRVEQLYRQFPEAYFIVLWRDPVEIYRSVCKASQTSRFFGKPGMLSRLIHYQEQVIRQTERIERRGANVLRLDYSSLVDQTEKVCREVSVFLGVPFHPAMLQLNEADLSAVYKAPHHAFLRRGIIERQQYQEGLVPAPMVQKLERFRRRWEEKQSVAAREKRGEYVYGQAFRQMWEWQKTAPDSLIPQAKSSELEPGLMEFFYHMALGRGLAFYDSVVRAIFEFVPLPWLELYRLVKDSIFTQPPGSRDAKSTLTSKIRIHWQTVGMASLVFGLIVLLQVHSNPHLLFSIIYALPCLLLAAVVGSQPAYVCAALAAFICTVIQFRGDSDYQQSFVFVWNFVSRFILLALISSSIARLRQELDLRLKG